MPRYQDVFEIVREIPLKDVIQRYSPSPPIMKYGKMWLLCPFHADKNPSVSVKGRWWRCFGCQVGGDGVDFVGRLYNLPAIDAAKQVARDFGLLVDVDKPLTTPQRKEIRRRQDRRRLEAVWRDGVNVLFRMAYVMRDAILSVIIPSNVGCDVIEMLVSVACLINTLETGDRDKILNVLNGGTTIWN